MFITNGKTNEQSVLDFERELQFRVPDDYRTFLQDTNGGACKNALIRPQQPGELLVDALFGLDGKNELNLRFWRNELRTEIPEKALIIGSDAGGGFLLLCMEAGGEGVYYYDHSYLFGSSSDAENTYLIYPTFSELYSDLMK